MMSGRSRVLCATMAGELADARSMGDNGIYQFFARFSASGAAIEGQR